LKIGSEQVGVSSLPVGDGQRQTANCLRGQNILINASSEMQDAAWEFVRFITNEASQKLRIPGKVLTLKTLYEDPRVKEAMPVISVGKEALENARPQPVSPHYSKTSRAMAEQFNSVLRDAIWPEGAVKILQSDLQQIIERGE